jgi:hypothetical protein
MRHAVMHPLLLALLALAPVASVAAAPTAPAEKTCEQSLGTNRLTYDCGFIVNHDMAGAPVTVRSSFHCTGACGPILGFGLGEGSAAGQGTEGRLVGGGRSADALSLTFVFDGAAAGEGAGARFTMNVRMNDGAGGTRIVACPVDVRLLR